MLRTLWRCWQVTKPVHIVHRLEYFCQLSHLTVRACCFMAVWEALECAGGRYWPKHPQGRRGRPGPLPKSPALQDYLPGVGSGKFQSCQQGKKLIHQEDIHVDREDNHSTTRTTIPTGVTTIPSWGQPFQEERQPFHHEDIYLDTEDKHYVIRKTKKLAMPTGNTTLPRGETTNPLSRQPCQH